MKGPPPRSTSGSLNNVLQARVLNLADVGQQDSVLYRLRKDWVLQFRLAPSLFGKRVTIYTNHPASESDGFQRTLYQKLDWQSDVIQSVAGQDDTAAYADLKIVLAGSFHYYFVYDDDSKPQGSGYFIVDPELTYGKKDEVLPLDCVQCQTHLSKCLGRFDEWRQRLTVAKEAGYNMLHFTPIQDLGVSQSAYSLRDQLKLNSAFNSKKSKYTLLDVGKLVKMMRDEWKVLSITDVVLNHTANESPWLQEHPECAYNLNNSPHLRPAYLLDQIIWQFTLEIEAGKWESSGIPNTVDKECQLQAIKDALHNFFLPQVKIHEFYAVNIESLVAEFRKRASDAKNFAVQTMNPCADLKIIQDCQYRRLQSTVDLDVALQHFNVARNDVANENHRLDKCCIDFEQKLKDLNRDACNLVQSHLTAAVTNVLSAMRYERLQSDGPCIKAVSKKHPLVPRYFTHSEPDVSFEEEEKLSLGEQSHYIMAQNGWVMGDDPLRNFAEADSNVYIRRELIVWNDSVKLRYGRSPDDCPYLWKHMREYVETTARIFHGIRLDNCHSTPIHVAEYLLDAARRIRPNLYVVAELFTQSENTDNVFVNRLGINSLIREAMSACDSHEQGRLVYRYGGEPVGAFYHCRLKPLTSSVAHAVFFDLTHDNPSPIEKRSVHDLLPSAALVSMACCATGSNRGYDELIPHHIHVVKESRLYPSFSTKNASSSVPTSLTTGIMAGRRALNKLHFELGISGFNEVYVDQVDKDIVAVTRHCPNTHESVVLVAFTAFQNPWNVDEARNIPPLRIQGHVEKVILEARLIHDGGDVVKFVKHESHINGLVGYRTEIKENIQLTKSDMSALDSQSDNGDAIEIRFKNFRPGSVIAFRISLNPAAQKSISELRKFVSFMGYNMHLSPKEVSIGSNEICQGLHDAVSKLDLVSLNKVLFKCEAEEQDDCPGRGVYNVPGYKSFLYAGLQGLMSVLSDIHVKNDLGHPLCENLRSGDWLPEYVTQRLRSGFDSSTSELAEWFVTVFGLLKQVPRYLIPSYFDAIISSVYSVLLSQSWNSMSSFVSDGSTFVRALALGSVALAGVVRSAPLPALAANISPPRPLKIVLDKGVVIERCTTLSAGLPHFSTGYMRNWGRDTFIALRGMFLVTGRFDEARFIILAFGGCLRHGLIPNLLDGGRKARFNCRDAVWWWLQSIQDYCTMVTNGHVLLKEPVRRLFPNDDASMEKEAVNQPLEVVVQEALQRHVQGVSFRERNAGFNLDMQMNDEGFNNRIGVDDTTGFVYGGNAHNCGTWMDKMGSSEVAGNKGKPATPRDGSAIEIVGLCKSALCWLIKMNEKGYYTFSSITWLENGLKKTMSMVEWNDKIQSNFESRFWIGTESECVHDPHPQLINRRNIYKDSLGASSPWADYQLRCNVPIAMVVAPEMFDPLNAWKALAVIEERLLGPLGMKTLDSSDWAYDGFYDNSNDSSNPNIAKGFNYHQGPEWLWPIGYFLRAKLHFARVVGGDRLFDETVSFVKRTLARHYEALQTSEWRGLPELTNKDGAYCMDSCRIQAWSHSCLLDVLYDMTHRQ